MSLIEHHDRIDKLVLQAYGWDAGMTDEAILLKLIELNKIRDAEERASVVHWLRPDYQIEAAGAEAIEIREMDLVIEDAAAVKPTFPSGPIEQAGAVAAALLAASEATSPEAVAAQFNQGKRVAPKIKSILAAFICTGFASTTDGGATFAARRATW